MVAQATIHVRPLQLGASPRQLAAACSREPADLLSVKASPTEGGNDLLVRRCLPQPGRNKRVRACLGRAVTYSKSAVLAAGAPQ